MRSLDTNFVLPIFIIVVLAAGSFLLAVSFALPDGDLTYEAIQNFSHFLLFAFLGWVVFFLVYRLMDGQYWKSVLLTGTGLVGLGLLIELFQMSLVSRDASVADIVLDIAGILVGVLVFSIPSFVRQKRNACAVMAVCVIVITVVLTMRTLVPLIGFDTLRPAIPVVRRFDHPFSTAKIETNGKARYSREATWQQECCVLRMVFEPELYSGIVFHERAARWSDYQSMSIKIYSYLPDTRQIILRINDRLHNNLYEDRYNGSFTIVPGFNELKVSLSQVAMMGNAESSGRRMNIDDVNRIQIFTTEIQSSFALDLLSIELY